MHPLCRFSVFAALAVTVAAPAQQVTLAGLRAQNGLGAFHGVKQDTAGNLFTLLDARDGVRLLKFDPTGTQLLAQTQIGTTGDTGIALALDPSGNVYVAGTSTSLGNVTGTSGTAFPNRADTTTNSFVARFTPALTEQWLTFCGSGKMAAVSIAATSTSVLVTGSIFAATLPVTSAGIQQTPASGSSGNGFVESFSPTAGTLQYATYITGFGGDTTPAAIAADASGNAYIAGTTTATGYPTTAALVPIFRAPGTSTVSGFVTKLDAAGDAFLFSTFVPGSGLTSVALDSTGTGSLLVSGNIAPGLFPLTNVQQPIAAPLTYQTAVRMPLDGSSVTSSTLLGPATESFIAPGIAGAAWVFADASVNSLAPLLPVLPVETLGNAFALRITASGTVDRAARFGGLAIANGASASLPVTAAGLTVALSGTLTLAGSAAPTLSASLLPTQQYDLPLTAAPNAALPNTVRDALPASTTCNGSACSGSAGLLAQLAPDATSPSLALSSDALPNLTLRNLGTGAATGIQLTASGYTLSSGCGTSLAAGAECSLALTGAGPGSITVTGANAGTFTTSLPATTTAVNPIAVLPRELDFGIQSAASAPGTGTLTITNLGTTSQTFTSANVSTYATTYTLSEANSTCTPTGTGTSKILAAGGTCTITLQLKASSTSTSDGVLNARWKVGTSEILVTAYAQAAALSLSATTIDFGRQYTGGLRSQRYLYLSNASDAPRTHTAVTSGNPNFTLTDECPATLQPHSVCGIVLSYNAATAPSSDAYTLGIDGLTATILGETLPHPSIGAASANPNLSVSPTSVTFANAVAVTTTSSETHTVVVANTGASAFAITLATTGDFIYTTNCPAMLAGNASCNVIVTFAPSAPGARQGLLSVSAGTSAPVYVALAGTGTAILPPNNSTIIFGNIPVGTPSVQWFKVSQPFTSFTVASSTINYKVILVEDNGYGHGQPIPSAFNQTTTSSCLNCYLGIQFLPTNTGVLAGTIQLSSPGNGSPEILAVTGTGTPLTGPILTPLAQDFGTVAVHSTSGIQIFQLTNGSTSTLAVSSVTLTGDFAATSDVTGGATCAGASLPAGASCFVPVNFSPAATGPRSGTLTIATAQSTVAATLTGTGAGDPGIAFSPTSLTFNNIPGASSTAQTVVITNTSSQSATVGTPTVSDTHFAVTGNCGTLVATANCTVTVSYTASISPATATLSLPITTAPAGAPSTATYAIALSGIYTAEDAGLQIIPGEGTTVNFGAAPTGSIATTRILHVNNNSSSALTVTVDTPREFAVTGSTCAGLAANASCDLTVTFTPLTGGDTTGTIFLQGQPTDGSATRNGLAYLEGYGVGTGTLHITGNISPLGVLSFGQIASGQTTTQTVTLTNPITAAAGTTITVRRVLAEFPYLSATTCGTPLAPGQSCTITITYAPLFQTTASTSPELDTGVLTIQTDDANSPLFVDLSGQATPQIVATPTTTAPLSAFAASQGSLTFGATPVGTPSAAQSITITNTGTVALHVLNLLTQSSFTATNGCGTLAAGAACTMNVSFVPQATGPIVGSLEIQTDSGTVLDFVSLYGSGITPAANAPSVSLAPTTINFGRILVASTASAFITVTNTGNTTVTYNGATITGSAFTLASASTAANPCPAPGNTLAAGASCSLAVVFAPTATGTAYGSVAVSTSATSVPLTVALSGVGTQPQLIVSPSALAFGTVTVGNNGTLALTLRNTSTSPVDGLAFSTTAGFSVSSTCGITTLTAGSSCSVSVTFTPTASDPATGTLTIASTDPASPVTIPLSGTGQAANPQLVISPTTLNFGTVTVGTSSTMTLALRNSGTLPANNLAFVATQGFTAGSTCGTTITAGSSCSVSVTFTATAPGPATGTLTITSNDPASPLTLTLSSTGQAANPQLAVTPASLDFGALTVGSSTTLTLALRNGGTLPANNLAFVTTAGFTVANTCGTSITGGSSCSVNVTFTPTAAGPATGTLTITSNDPASPLTVPLTGTGQAVAAGSFTLTVNGASTGSANVVAGLPASYALSITPTNGYTGTVALTCTADTPAQYAACSLVPPIITLTTGSQASTANIATVSASSSSRPAAGPAIASAVSNATRPYRNPRGLVMAFLPLGILMMVGRRRHRLARLLVLFIATLLVCGGCGSGGDNRIRYVAAGTYTFHVTATSTTSVPVSQTVALTLVVTQQ